MTNTQTALAVARPVSGEVIEQSPEAVVEWNLDNWPTDRFNRLVPTQTLGMATDLIRPIVQTVQLDIERDTYESSQLPRGHRAPNARGLALLAGAAGIDFPDEVRLDDASNPDRAVAKIWATMIDGTGRPRTVVGSRDYDVSRLTMTDAQRKQAKGFLFENAVTRARHRAMRVMLGLPQSYSVAELLKPFAVVSYVVNHAHPEVRKALIAGLVPAVAALYGGSPKQLAAGPEVVELTDDDDDTPAPATPPTLPGEKLAKAKDDDVPDWAQPSTGAPAAKSKPIDEALAELADASGLQGKAQPPQLEKLSALIGRDSQLDWQGEVVPVLLRAFGQEFNPGDMSAGQAQAVINAADSFQSVEAFLEAWRQAAA